ncbi:MAG: VOC family protein [Thermoleophilia bacterium]
MGLDGIHHVTAISGDAQRAIDFHAGVLGLRLVKTTVNFDAPDMYHLYFGDETGSPGSILTFFEIRGAPEGRAGAGMISRIVFRVPSEASLAFWAERLGDAGRPVERADGAVVSSDPEGLGLELVVHEAADGAPRAATAAGIPAEHAITGIAGVRAHTEAPDFTREMLERIGFAEEGTGRFVTTGAERRGLYLLDEAPAQRGIPGAGTVHHVAWTAPDAEHEAWGARARQAGQRPTDVIDRQYFHSIYFREPGGVLFELATPSPGFAVDEDPAALGMDLKLPPQYEPYRERIEERLTPLRRPEHPVAAAAATEEEGR